MKTLVFATNNAHKLEELRAIAADTFDVRSLNDRGKWLSVNNKRMYLALETHFSKQTFIENRNNKPIHTDDT